MFVRADGIRQRARIWAAGMLPQGKVARQMSYIAMVQSTGFGVFLTSSAIFFTRTIGLTSGQVGVGLSVANVLGLAFTVPLGRFADSVGARNLLLIVYVGLAVLFASFCMVGDFPWFIIVASLLSVGETSVTPLRMTLTRALCGPQERLRVSAQARSLSNIGFMLGAMAAGAALALGGRGAFYAVVLSTAAAQAACAAVLWRLPAPAPRREHAALPARPRAAHLDVRVVGLAILSGILEMYQPLLTVGLPLWIITHTRAPASVNSALLVLDTVLVFLLQVPLSRSAETTAGSARMLRRAGVLLGASCLVFALTEGTGALVSIPLLVAGAAILGIGEVSHAAGSFGLSLHMPPPQRQGEYQGVFALGRGLQRTAGPALIAMLVTGFGRAGWSLLAALFLLAGGLSVPLTRIAVTCKSAQALQPQPGR